MPTIGHVPLGRLHLGVLQPWIAERRCLGVSVGTINHGLHIVRRILNLAPSEWMDEQGLTRGAAPTIQRPTCRGSLRQPSTCEQAGRRPELVALRSGLLRGPAKVPHRPRKKSRSCGQVLENAGSGGPATAISPDRSANVHAASAAAGCGVNHTGQQLPSWGVPRLPMSAVACRPGHHCQTARKGTQRLDLHEERVGLCLLETPTT
jgi:hypothetical protein